MGDLTNNQIGSFLRYFPVPSTWFNCVSKGLLFSESQFLIVEFINDTRTYYCHVRWTTASSMNLITNFFSTTNKSFNISVFHALNHYSFSFVHSSAETEIRTSFLGAGANGFVFRVANTSNPTAKNFAMKFMLIRNPRQKAAIEIEYSLAEHLMGNDLPSLNAVVGVVKNSLHFGKINNKGLWVEYCSYLMPHVGTTFDKATVNLTMKQEMLKALYKVHLAGVAHGDARLANCIYTTNGEYRWIDFSETWGFGRTNVKEDLTTFLRSIQISVDTPNVSEQWEEYWKCLDADITNQEYSAGNIARIIEKLLL